LFKGNYTVIADQAIDADNVCATFAAMSKKLGFNLIESDKKLLAEASRYGDYFDKVSDQAMKIALTIDAMRFGKNKFEKPFFMLTPEQNQELFNEIMEAMPRMLINIEQFKDLYETELNNLKSAAKRAVEENLIKRVTDNVVVLDEALPPQAVYQVSDCKVAVYRTDLGEGRFNYNPIGKNPRTNDKDLTKLWEKFREAENQERVKRGLSPLDPSNSWGGRDVAGGPPKDQSVGSILTLEQVTSIIERCLAGEKKPALIQHIEVKIPAPPKEVTMPAPVEQSEAIKQPENPIRRPTREEIIEKAEAFIRFYKYNLGYEALSKRPPEIAEEMRSEIVKEIVINTVTLERLELGAMADPSYDVDFKERSFAVLETIKRNYPGYEKDDFSRLLEEFSNRSIGIIISNSINK
ncbi:DUF6687 family protein, partial [Candidatus Margulisiibacteriota bacterium]